MIFKHGGHKAPMMTLGMTLVEVLAAIALLGCFSLFLLVRLNPVDGDLQQLDTCVQLLQEDLRETQQWAWTERVWYSVEFYQANNSYKVLRQGSSVKTVSLPAQVTLANSPLNITFLPTGFPNQGTRIILKSGGKQRVVVVAAITGRVREE